ncbi:MAG: hypothetical protein NTW26_02380, partial [bacterium]|nr:hypothetical protein [bacterium]
MTVEERLEKVERELATAKRRNQRLLIAAGLLLGISALAWLSTVNTSPVLAQEVNVKTPAITESGNIIRANGFVLEDAEGRGRAVLEMMAGGPRLGLYDENGQIRVALVAFEDGPMLALIDENGEIRDTLVSYKGGPALGLYDDNGKIRAGLDMITGGPRL